MFFFYFFLVTQNVTAAPRFNEVDEFLDAAFQTDQVNLFIRPVVIKQYECLVKVLGVVSKETSLDNLWTFSEQRFRNNVANWRNCGDLNTSAGAL